MKGDDPLGAALESMSKHAATTSQTLDDDTCAMASKLVEHATATRLSAAITDEIANAVNLICDHRHGRPEAANRAIRDLTNAAALAATAIGEAFGLNGPKRPPP